MIMRQLMYIKNYCGCALWVEGVSGSAYCFCYRGILQFHHIEYKCKYMSALQGNEGIQVKTATSRIGDKQNGDTPKRQQPERRQLRSYRRQIVKMAKFASGNADTFGQIGDNFGRIGDIIIALCTCNKSMPNV